jgi:hypothetical protein
MSSRAVAQSSATGSRRSRSIAPIRSGIPPRGDPILTAALSSGQSTPFHGQLARATMAIAPAAGTLVLSDGG